MLFVQPLFLFVVLPIGVVLFYSIGRIGGPLSATAVLVFTSLVFYAPYGPGPLTLLVGSLCINFLTGFHLLNCSNKRKTVRRTLLLIGQVVNFGGLFVFKYLDSIATLISSSAVLGVLVPAGISFYTFHQAAFLQDAYNREPHVTSFFQEAYTVSGATAAFLRYAAFVGLFPQLIIGPIVYMKEFGPQILSRRFGLFSARNLQVGITLLTFGLFKKLWIADPIGEVVDPVYSTLAAGHLVSQPEAALALFGFFFQLYFDFSGYSDCALGIARLFGIRLPINFDSPLRAVGIMDYYRRWHITLTRVIVRFIFTPLCLRGARFTTKHKMTGVQQRLFMMWIPLALNFQLIALWHSAKWTFVLFGALHGFWYIIETEVRNSAAFKNYRKRTSDRLRGIIGMTITVLPLAATFALFKSESVGSFWTLLVSASGLEPVAGGSHYINRRVWVGLLAAAAIVYLLPNLYELLKRYRPGIFVFNNPSQTPAIFALQWRPTLLWGAIVALMIVCLTVRLNVPIPFIYAGF